jgi:hypothetical protein
MTKKPAAMITPVTTASNPLKDPPPFSEGYIDQDGVSEPLALVQRKPQKPLFLDEESLHCKARKSLSPRLAELANMLEWSRPDRSQTEELFIEHYIDTLPGIQKDTFGNRWTRIGKAKPGEGPCNVAYTSHTDTVAWVEGAQAIEIDKDGDFALDWNSQGDCLGADCTAGVWLMRRLILAGKHGLYIFHRAEESGGDGSTWIVENNPDLVKGIEVMISLDRRGYDSIITEQSTGVTASKTFALSMQRQLGGAYKPDPTGTFTDSAFYSHLIPECTNLSIGYHNCHSTSETLDFRFTDSLLKKLLKLDYSKLEVTRDPTARQDRWSRFGFKGWDSYEDPRWTDYLADDTASTGAGSTDNDQDQEDDTHDGYEYNSLCVDSDLAALVHRHPEAVAMLLGQWDLGEGDVYEAIAELKGMRG